jgi:hypothetical protein
MRKLSPTCVVTSVMLALAASTAFAQTAAAPAARATVTQNAAMPAQGTRATVTQNGNTAATTAASPGTANTAPGTGPDMSSGTTSSATTAGTNTVGVLPGNAGIGVVIPTDASGTVYDANGNPLSVNNIAPAAASSTSTTTIVSTPLLDKATRDASAREARERRSGQEPRIIGIAPRTNADKVNQMPDDPVIRY